MAIFGGLVLGLIFLVMSIGFFITLIRLGKLLQVTKVVEYGEKIKFIQKKFNNFNNR